MRLLLIIGMTFIATSAIAVEMRWPTPTEVDQVVKAIRETFPDPYTIRDAEMSQVLAMDEGGFICVHANAKNRFGGYSGMQYYIGGVWFKERPAEIHPAGDEDTAGCKKLAYRPFTELPSE